MNQTAYKIELESREVNNYNLNYNGRSNSYSNNVRDNYNIFAELSNDILELIKSNPNYESFIQKLLSVINKVIKIEGYSIFSKIKDEKLLEANENFDLQIQKYLLDGGLIQLSLNEKRSLLIDYEEQSDESNSKKLLIIPVVFSENAFIIFCLLVLGSKSEIFNSIFPIIEVQFNLAGSYLLNRLIDNENKKLMSTLSLVEKNIHEELSYSTAGKICLKSFHSLKNKTQIIVSSFNLLTKLMNEINDERIEKIFGILSKEIPEFARSIKLISDFSKTLISNSKPVYFEFDRFVDDLKNIYEITGISKNLKINFVSKISRSKFFGYTQKLFQAFLLILFELSSIGLEELYIDNEEDENKLRIKLNFPLVDGIKENVKCLLDEKSNVKFARIKNLFEQNSCSLITNSGNEYFEIIISIPKRSSQFKQNTFSYVKDFDS
jgi:hypothetical protein